MRKYILTTALTFFGVATASAQQQEFGYGYDYQPETPSYSYQVQEYNLQQPSQGYGYNQAHQDTQVIAVEQEQYNEVSHDRKWDFSVVTGVRVGSDFKGSDSNTTKLFVAPIAEYRIDPMQKLFLNMDNGLGYSYAMSKNLEIGAGIGYREGRNNGADALFTGLSDIDKTATYHAFADYKYHDYNFGIKFEKGIDSSNDGLTAELSAGYKQKVSPKLVLGTELAAIYGDDSYMEQNFGVSAAQATGFRAQSDADAGFSEASLKVFGNYNISGPHSVNGAVKYTKFLGDAKDSSLIKDDTQLAMTLGYGYAF